MSMLIPVIVLMREMASAPDEAAARAVGRTSEVLGESFTISGSVVAQRTAAVTSATAWGLSPKTAPPARTLGQETLSSMPATPGTASSCPASLTNSSVVSPAMLTMTGVCHVAQIGAYFSMTIRMPGFSNPIAFNMPDAVSTVRGCGLPLRGCSVVPLQTTAPMGASVDNLTNREKKCYPL